MFFLYCLKIFRLFLNRFLGFEVAADVFGRFLHVDGVLGSLLMLAVSDGYFTTVNFFSQWFRGALNVASSI